MMNLFSSFDLKYFTFVITNILFINYFFFPKTFKTNNILMFWMKIYIFLMNFLDSIKNNSDKMTKTSVISLMAMILMLNLNSEFGFMFPTTSIFSGTLFMGSTLWVGMNLYKNMKNFKSFLFHLIPEGSPKALILILMGIELISNVIRPLTVSIRLTANILAGHLLMIILSESILNNTILAPSYMLLNMVEMLVCIIQAYIFGTMIWLYYAEI